MSIYKQRYEIQLIAPNHLTYINTNSAADATAGGRPSPLYYAKRFSERYGAQIYLKREDLNHTGAHKN